MTELRWFLSARGKEGAPKEERSLSLLGERGPEVALMLGPGGRKGGVNRNKKEATPLLSGTKSLGFPK